MYIDVHVKYTLFLSDLLKIELFRQISQKCSNIKLHTNRSSGSGVVPERRCSGAELFRSGDVPERRCSGAELFRSGDVPERRCSGAELFRPGRRMEKETDVTTLMVAFGNSANAPQNHVTTFRPRP